MNSVYLTGDHTSLELSKCYEFCHEGGSRRNPPLGPLLSQRSLYGCFGIILQPRRDSCSHGCAPRTLGLAICSLRDSSSAFPPVTAPLHRAVIFLLTKGQIGGWGTRLGEVPVRGDDSTRLSAEVGVEVGAAPPERPVRKQTVRVGYNYWSPCITGWSGERPERDRKGLSLEILAVSSEHT